MSDENNSKPNSAEKKETAEKMTAVEEMSSIIDKLHDIEDHTSQENLALLKRISQLYWKKVSKRKDMADLFVTKNLTELLVSMYKSYNEQGMFTNDDVWFNAYYVMNCWWNYSDASPQFAKDLAEKGVVQYMAKNIGHEPYLTNRGTKNVYYVLKSSLSILQNLSRALDTKEERDLFETANVKELLRKNFLSSDDEFTRTLATMILTAIISEEENKMLTENKAIPYMVRCLGKALADKSKRRFRGFSPTEIVECISRMSVNDKNKIIIVEEGALPHLVKMLEYDADEKEQAEAAHAIWNLGFDHDLRQKLKDEPGLIDALEKRKTSTDKNVSKYATGALWTLNEEAREITQSTDSKKDHVFISYAWANQDMVKQTNAALKNAGFRTWVDFEQMGGSTLEAMACAIEDAAVVLICASEKYKLSPNCRTEAEYTFQIKKPIVPLMMQRYYKPDGWLGMLLGAKFYVNFDGKYDFNTAFNMLLKELAGRGRDEGNVRGRKTRLGNLIFHAKLFCL